MKIFNIYIYIYVCGAWWLTKGKLALMVSECWPQPKSTLGSSNTTHFGQHNFVNEPRWPALTNISIENIVSICTDILISVTFCVVLLFYNKSNSLNIEHRSLEYIERKNIWKINKNIYIKMREKMVIYWKNNKKEKEKII